VRARFEVKRMEFSFAGSESRMFGESQWRIATF
jgi:hypothetical protein